MYVCLTVRFHTKRDSLYFSFPIVSFSFFGRVDSSPHRLHFHTYLLTYLKA